MSKRANKRRHTSLTTTQFLRQALPELVMMSFVPETRVRKSGVTFISQVGCALRFDSPAVLDPPFLGKRCH
jgi:hypothetical protein